MTKVSPEPAFSAADAWPFSPVEGGAAHPEGHPLSLDKGQRLFEEGEAADTVYLLQEGLVKLIHDVEPGHQATVRLVRPGEVLGLTSALSGDPYGLSAEAMEASHVLSLPSPLLLLRLQERPSVAFGLLKRMAQELRRERLTLLQRSEHDAASKVAGLLLSLGTKPGPLRITRAALGELSGSAQETVSRVLGRLDGLGLIKRQGHRIVINDREGLQKMAAKRRTTAGG